MQAPPGNILIVDDDPLNRRLLIKHLENDGHRTTQFDNGFAALAAIRDDPPDLVLLDVEMPGLDGVEVTRQIRADPTLGGTSIVLLTGRTEESEVAAGLAAGADAYLTKPFSPQDLQAQVSALIGDP
jgi:CheY-like chemotaxis protein